MNIYHILSIILSLVIILGYLNHRLLRIQSMIAVMAAALFISLLLVASHHLKLFAISRLAHHMTQTLSIDKLLVNGLLGFLLFANALSVRLTSHNTQKAEIATLASLSSLFSIASLAIITYYLFHLLNVKLSFFYCSLFAALITPTDSIIVLAGLKYTPLPGSIRHYLNSESLFSVGIGIILFATLGMIGFSQTPTETTVLPWLFLKQIIGGLLYGALLGWLISKLLEKLGSNSPSTAIEEITPTPRDGHTHQSAKLATLLTLVVVSGGYTMALWLHLSAMLAMFASGLVISYRMGNKLASIINQHLRQFWQLIAGLIYILLFTVIGFELIVLPPIPMTTVIAALGVMLVLLLIRWMMSLIPIKSALATNPFNTPKSAGIITWSGLRGGLALALALSLPINIHRDSILLITYVVAVFSVIVQGISLPWLQKFSRPGDVSIQGGSKQ